MNNFYGMGGQTAGETMAFDYLARVGAGVNPQSMHAERVDGYNPLAVADAIRRKRELIEKGEGFNVTKKLEKLDGAVHKAMDDLEGKYTPMTYKAVDEAKKIVTDAIKAAVALGWPAGSLSDRSIDFLLGFLLVKFLLAPDVEAPRLFHDLLSQDQDTNLGRL